MRLRYTTVAYNKAPCVQAGFYEVITQTIDGENHGTFTNRLEPNAILQEVTFITHPGFRIGCVASGVLGFASGLLTDEAVPDAHHMREVIAVKFDGQKFIRQDTMQPVDKCRRLLLTARGAYAQFVPDLVPSSEPANVESDLLITV